MENTSNYLQKEVESIEIKIEDAKETVRRELGIILEKHSTQSTEDDKIVEEEDEDDKDEEEEEEGEEGEEEEEDSESYTI